MNSLAIGMSLSGFIVVIATWFVYLRTIPRMKVPVNPIGSKILQLFGIGLGVFSIFSNYQNVDPANIAWFIPAVFAVLMGALFFWLLSLRKTPIGEIKVKVGDKILPFQAVTSEGGTFNTDELAGKRILMKFFRGGW